MPWPSSPVWPFELCSFQLRPLPLPSFLVSSPSGLRLLHSVTTSNQGQEGSGTGTFLALQSPPDITCSVTRIAQWFLGHSYTFGNAERRCQNELQQAGPKMTGLYSVLDLPVGGTGSLRPRLSSCTMVDPCSTLEPAWHDAFYLKHSQDNCSWARWCLPQCQIDWQLEMTLGSLL